MCVCVPTYSVGIASGKETESAADDDDEVHR